MAFTYVPRNDIVLIERVQAGKVRGLHMPDQSEEGVFTYVKAIGPKVEGLQVGDRVLGIGTPGQDLVRVPGEANLFLLREGNVLCVVQGKPDGR